MGMKKILKILLSLVLFVALVGIAQSVDPARVLCSVVGSASSTSVLCDANNGANEDNTDATLDACTDGANAGSPDAVLDIEVFENANPPNGQFDEFEQVKVTCTLDCFNANNEYSVVYKHGINDNWQVMGFGNCPGIGVKTVTHAFNLNDTNTYTAEDHYIRCWIGWSQCNNGDTCCVDTYADNDDVKIDVFGDGQPN